MPSIRPAGKLLFSLFFASGVAGLIYEVVWTRQLTLLFGVSVYAVSAVLAAFMLGLALGGYLFGQLVDRWRNPLAAYGGLELVVAAYAIFFPLLHGVAETAYVSAHGSLASREAVLAVRFVLALVLLLPPATLLGGTFPVVAKLFSADFDRFGSSLAKLYGVNTLGAVGGAFLAGFVLIQMVGTTGATAVAITLSLLVGAVALWMSRRTTARVAPQKEQASSITPSAARYRRWLRPAALVAVAVSGFCSLGYEVLWTKILVLHLGNSTWAFSTTLVTFLLSLALGSFLIAPWLDRRIDRLVLFAALQSGVAVFAALSLPAFRWMAGVHIGGEEASLPQVVLAHFGVAAAVMFPATLLLGTALPLAAKIYTDRPEAAGQGLGTSVAANTVGAVCGSVVAGFILVPLLGIQNGVLFLALLNASLAVSLVALAPVRRAARALGLAATSVVALALFFALLPSKRPLELPPPGFEPLYYDEGVAGTVSIYHHPETGLKILNINHVTEVATDPTSMVTFRLMAYLPVLLHPDPKEVLVVTFGAGIVTGTLAQLDLERIDCVEINPRAPEIGKVFAEENRRATENPKVRLVVEDGRNFLLTTPERYDIITADATHPTGADSWVLYTREYYALCRERLKPGGLFLQWLPLHALSPADYRTILATCSSQFNQVALWFTGLEGEVGHTLLMGAVDELPIDVDRIQERLKTPAIAADLARYDLDSPEALLALFVGDRSGVEEIARAAPINTDDRAITSFPRELPRPGLAFENLEMILATRSFPQLLLAGDSQAKGLRTAWMTSGWLLQAQLAMRRQDVERARELLFRARDAGTDLAFLETLIGSVSRQVAEIELRRGDQWLEQGRAEAARQAYESAAAVSESWAQPHLKLAALDRRLGNLEQAYAALRQAVALEPSGEAYFNLALLADELNRTREAISAYLGALRHEPGLAIAYTNLGRIYARQGEWDKARWAWERALQIDPDDQLARRNLRRLRDEMDGDRGVRE